MRKIFVFATIALGAVVAASCTKDRNAAPAANGDGSITIGFENTTPRTFLNSGNTDSPVITWYTTANDKVLYVFRKSDNKKYAYVSTSTTEEVVRSFEPDTNVPDLSNNYSYAIWTGRTANYDNTKISGGKITSDGSLTLPSTQSINKFQSFEMNTNIAVAKPGDDCLKNVFGYLRYQIPTGTKGKATIKSVKFEADENLAGKIQIDYSGDNPVATIISNGSKSLTINTRYLNGYYEGNYIWAVMVPGTYHNFRVTITPFVTEGTSEDAATGTPFTLYGGTVSILRSQWTDGGVLPNKNPLAPEWCGDKSAFDYGYPDGTTHKASIVGPGGFNVYGVYNDGTNTSLRNITEPIIVDGITYGGPGMIYYGNRISASKVQNLWNDNYPNVIPAKNYFAFKINRPGTLRFYGASSNRDAIEGTNPVEYAVRIPTYRIAMITRENGELTARVIKQVTPAEVPDGQVSDNRTDSNIYSSAWSKYWVTIDVTAADLAGMEEAPTLYLYHVNSQVNSLSVLYWPLEWTPTPQN
ncbi:MAG: hypothetical protein J5771_05070 [Bacteroidales bacterium]|nr:hypothetical protein [Bacteroidales bacterium]